MRYDDTADTELSSVSSRLARWSEQLAMSGVPSPMPDARALAAHALGVKPGELFLRSRFKSGDVMRIDALVRRRATREPLQYITGSVGFLGLDLQVGPGVFVPRPETELMADHVVKYLLSGAGDRLMTGQEEAFLSDGGDRFLSGRGVDSMAGRKDHFLARHRKSPAGSKASSGHMSVGSSHADVAGSPSPTSDAGAQIQVVDLCTGSGALGLAIATNVAGVACVGVEASPAASDYAKRNAVQCADALAEVGSSFVALQADAISVADADLAHLQGAVDVVVCNPPYVPDAALPREPEVRDYDPAEALYGGPDGLGVVRRLVVTAARLLRPGGLLAIEHADSQGESAGSAGVPALLREYGLGPDEGCRSEAVFQQVVDHLDLNDRPRFTTAIRCS